MHGEGRHEATFCNIRPTSGCRVERGEKYGNLGEHVQRGEGTKEGVKLEVTHKFGVPERDDSGGTNQCEKTGGKIGRRTGKKRDFFSHHSSYDEQERMLPLSRPRAVLRHRNPPPTHSKFLHIRKLSNPQHGANNSTCSCVRLARPMLRRRSRVALQRRRWRRPYGGHLHDDPAVG